MIMKKTFLLVLCCISFLYTSCSSNDDGVKFNFVPLRILAVELPETFTLNESYDIKVRYLRPNNCIFFDGFDITSPSSTERTVVAFGSELENSSCVEIADEAEEYFNFTCKYPGTYRFNFWWGELDGEQQYLVLEVPVVSE